MDLKIMVALILMLRVVLLVLLLSYCSLCDHIGHGGFSDDIGPDNYEGPNDHSERYEKV